MLDKIRKWYEGVYVPFESDPYSPVVFTGGGYQRHWTAQAARVLVEFYLREWRWLWPTAIGVGSLSIAILRMG